MGALSVSYAMSYWLILHLVTLTLRALAMKPLSQPSNAPKGHLILFPANIQNVDQITTVNIVLSTCCYNEVKRVPIMVCAHYTA
jgi:hypothetical protein